MNQRTNGAVGTGVEAGVREADERQPSQEELLKRLRLANAAKRCTHLKINGEHCGSPAMQGHGFCYLHDRMWHLPWDGEFPPLEDADAVQMALWQTLDLLQKRKLDPRIAGLLLWGLQTAAANLRRTTFGAGAEEEWRRKQEYCARKLKEAEEQLSVESCKLSEPTPVPHAHLSAKPKAPAIREDAHKRGGDARGAKSAASAKNRQTWGTRRRSA
jgi:hypothetical protein